MNNAPPPAGTLVLVVGPSGAGKDTLLNLAKDARAGDERFRFVQRIITRAAGRSEHSEFTPEKSFLRRVEEGAFALHRQAHGLFYGLPAYMDAWLAEGRVVVANGSRSALPEALRKYLWLKMINIIAPPELLAERGREGDDVSK